MHTDLAAYEAWYKGFTPSPAITSRISGLASALWEIQVMPPTTQPAAFTMRRTLRAASIPALRQLVAAFEERVGQRNAAGGAGSVWLSVAGGSAVDRRGRGLR
jgi:hypothetical protein